MKTEKVVNHIVTWLKEYSEEAGTKGFCVGVSGGVDSAVVSTLCAMTKLPVTCLVMPIHQNEDETDRARNHIDWLSEQFNINAELNDLTHVFEEFSLAVALEESPKRDLALANTRSRLRMVNLYYHATVNNFLVAGTGNRIEDFGVGFFTKYGDGGVDISPIADLLKSEVYKIAEFLGINEEIIDATPTDGLWDDERTDETQLGMTYEEAEWAHAYHDVFNHDTLDYFADTYQIQRRVLAQTLTDRQKQVLKTYRKFNTANKHKMNPIPVCDIPEEYL